MANISRSRKSGFTLRSGVMRRETAWIGGVEFAQTMGAGVSVLISSLGATVLALRPLTVVRTRGVLFGRSDQNAASENWSVAYGFAVVSDQASGIGITAIPTPVTDDQSDLWFVYERIMGNLAFSSGVGFQNSGTMIPIDSKAMRKIEDGQDLVEVVENGTTSTDGAAIHGHARILIKLH